MAKKKAAETINEEPESTSQPQPEESVEAAFDTSPSDMPEIVPDPPFCGRYELKVSVDFPDAEGNDVHLDPGVIDGTSLPVEFAETLFAQGKLVKA